MTKGYCLTMYLVKSLWSADSHVFAVAWHLNMALCPIKVLDDYISIRMVLKSGYPKILRIGRQKRKKIFFLFSPEPIWLTIFGNDIKRLDCLFLYSKFAKPENSATGPSTAAMRLEIWHMFYMLIRTHQMSS